MGKLFNQFGPPIQELSEDAVDQRVKYTMLDRLNRYTYSTNLLIDDTRYGEHHIPFPKLLVALIMVNKIDMLNVCVCRLHSQYSKHCKILSRVNRDCNSYHLINLPKTKQKSISIQRDEGTSKTFL